jgi:NADH-quinone oxidoreductase subunit L
MIKQILIWLYKFFKGTDSAKKNNTSYAAYNRNSDDDESEFFLWYYMRRWSEPKKYFNELVTSFLGWYYWAYFLALFTAVVNSPYWQLLLIIAISAEIIFIIFSAFYDKVYIARIIFAIAMLYILHRSVSGFDVLKEADDMLAKVGFDEFFELRENNRQLKSLTKVAYYWWFYFLALFLPYACATLLLFLPLLSSIIALFFGFAVGYVLIGYICTLLLFLTACSALYILLIFPMVRVNYINYIDNCNMRSIFFREDFFSEPEPLLLDFIRSTESLSINLNFGAFIDTPFFYSGFEFSIDSITGIMAATISIISFLVHAYTIVYMRNDPHIVRFYGFLSLFTFFMLMLVTASDLIMLYIGWEGVGLVSFLLIAFWYTRVAAQKAALKAILINKIGDMFLLFAIALVGHYTRGSMSYFTIPDGLVGDASSTNYLPGFSNLDLICVAITLAAFVKSAQLFFHTWLPDAMEGPTPVSALLHAATMVTAGVYLIVRFSYIIELSGFARGLMLTISVWTILVTSLIACFQFDIKKIIAYSTCGQLALMFLSCSLSGYDFALYHFFNHAFFKCALFLLAGVIIHQLRNEQDIRGMGGLMNVMPYTFTCFLIASLSLCGFPFFSGATSKDLIISLIDDQIIKAFADFYASFNSSEITWARLFHATYFLKVRGIVVFMTSIYMARLIYYIFLTKPRFRRRLFPVNYMDASLESKIYLSIFFFLTIMSIAGGKTFKHFFVFTEGYYINIQNDTVVVNIDTTRIALYNPLWVLNYISLLIIVLALYAIYNYKKINGGFPIHEWLNVDHPLMNYFPIFRFRLLLIFGKWRLRALRDFIRNHLLSINDIYTFFNKKCYFDDIYSMLIVRPIFELSRIFRDTEVAVFAYLANLAARTFRKISKFSNFVAKSGIMDRFWEIVFSIIFIFLSLHGIVW